MTGIPATIVRFYGGPLDGEVKHVVGNPVRVGDVLRFPIQARATATRLDGPATADIPTHAYEVTYLYPKRNAADATSTDLLRGS